MADLPTTAANHPDSKRAFQTQFRRWGFPLKQNPVYRDARLAARVHELWERNRPQREMLRILGEDGFEVRERELVRLRARNNWMLRDPRGDRQQHQHQHQQEEDMSSPDVPAGPVERDGAGDVVAEERPAVGPRKRRRRTRGWAGRPADPPGPPRFPSETTIDEARVILCLDGEGYRAVRAGFQRICEEGGLVKKTLAGPERWEAAKAQLVAEVAQLRDNNPAGRGGEAADEDGERRRLALDIICTDVTKRMRDGDRRMTLGDAKKVLGVNPEETRSLRAGFYRVLAGQEVQVRCKSTAGQARWGALMAEWMRGSELVRGLLPGDQGTAEYRERWKALDILATDVMKRMRDERMRKEARGKRSVGGGEAAGPGTGTKESVAAAPEQMGSTTSPASIQVSPTECAEDDGLPVMSDYDTVSPLPLLVSDPLHVPLPLDSMSSPHLLDTTLPSRLNTQLLLPSDAASYPQHQPYFMPSLPYSPLQAQSTIGIYLRLHPSSTYVVPGTPPLWIATLGSHSLRELRGVAAGRFGDAAVCVGVEGVVRDGKGGECALGIAGDEELGAYLAHLEGATPTFNVTLAWNG